MKSGYIVDTTLRDGEQAPGVIFNKEDKLNIADMLDKAGIDIIEAGIPAMGEIERSTLKEMSEKSYSKKLLTWNRMLIEDVDYSIKCGIKNIHVSVPVSDIQIQRKLKKDRGWVLNETKKVLDYALSKNCEVSIGAEDSSRADINFLIRFYKLAKKYGAKRVRYADTVGCLDPINVYEIIKRIKTEINIDIDFHGHNDFGMATANALSAYKAGAKYISCSVNGLGERAGNTALEEIVMALKYMEGIDTVDTSKLTDLSKMVELASGRINAANKPIVGKSVFSHESGIHVDGLLKESSNYEYLSPKDLGREHEILIGKFSGKKSIINKFEKMGLVIDDIQANEILNVMKEYYFKDKKTDIEELLQSFINSTENKLK